MKPKSNYSRPMAAIYIIISFLATLIVLELICFLTFYPFGEQVSAYICKLNMALCRSFCLL